MKKKREEKKKSFYHGTRGRGKMEKRKKNEEVARFLREAAFSP